MGHHRAAPGSTLETPQTPETLETSETTARYVGRRRAAVVEEAPQPTAYVGRRRAVVAPVEPPAATPATHPLLDTGTIRRVLADLEPADQSTSFTGEATAVLPLLRPTTPPPHPAPAPGRRRAVKHAGPRGPLFAKLPSVPVLLGVATLALSVGGVVTTATSSTTPDLAAGGSASVGSIGAVSGTDGVGRVTSRDEVLSRDSRRDTLDSASGGDLDDAVEEQLAERNDALGQLAQEAEERAAYIAENRWVAPMTGYRLTATFGQYGLWASYHTGLDFAAPSGTPILSVANGTVTSTGYDGAYGYKTVVTLEDGTEVWYAHQSSVYVSVGESVAAGDTIGAVGSTGNVTGAHLHLEVRPGGGDPVAPFAALAANGVGL